jgi:uncharacterized repeat protein (TIGR03803 family)
MVKRGWMSRGAWVVVMVLVAGAQAQTFTTLYNFTGVPDGAYSYAGVIQDSSGNLYGTTNFGGVDLVCQDYSEIPGCGVVYEINSAGVETLLYTFCSQQNCTDGADPHAAVVRDEAGNIYGTTSFGGSSQLCQFGCGTVFKLDTAGNETVLYSFSNGSDGCNPAQGLVSDEAGNLYGTTSACGSSGHGTIFKIDIAGNFTLLHSFGGRREHDGAVPLFGHLTMDKSGNIYGLTSRGGNQGFGALYKLSKSGTLSLLLSFNDSEGSPPLGSVLRDDAGNFYGTTYMGGLYGSGALWKVSKKGKKTVLHNFDRNARGPQAGVTRDSKGNLYGVTDYGGTFDNGVLYKFSADGTYTLLHSFDGLTDGEQPLGEVLWTPMAPCTALPSWAEPVIVMEMCYFVSGTT